MEQAFEIARELLKIKAVQIRTDNYFTWTSGIKSPIYCDNRLTMSYPDVREKIIDGFIDKIDSFSNKPGVIAGCATAGIPHAAWIAEKMNVPMVYVRSEAKGHGKENQIEGHIAAGDDVIVIEDLISTGGSSIDAALALREAGANVIGVVAIFSYGLKKAKENFKAANLPHTTITNFDYLLDLLVKEDELTESEKAQLLKWRDSVM